MPTRETVLDALLAQLGKAQLNGEPAFKTTSRHIDLVPDSATQQVAIPIEQPAIFLIDDHEMTVHEGWGTPPTRTWFAELWCWCKCPDGNTPNVPDGITPGSSVINPLIEAIEAVLVPDDILNSNEFTLGGLVQSVRIEGGTVKISGDANPQGQCFFAIQLKILVP